MAVHGIILVGFLLYSLFLAGPLFDRFEATSGISMLHDISLLGETDNIMWGLSRHTIDTATIPLDGWAFIEGQSAENSQIYIVLKSDSITYVFDTILQKRPDVTAAYVESGLNLDDSGFIARIAKEYILDGNYRLGIYIKKGDIEALQYTDRVVEF